MVTLAVTFADGIEQTVREMLPGGETLVVTEPTTVVVTNDVETRVVVCDVRD